MKKTFRKSFKKAFKPILQPVLTPEDIAKVKHAQSVLDGENGFKNVQQLRFYLRDKFEVNLNFIQTQELFNRIDNTV